MPPTALFAVLALFSTGALVAALALVRSRERALRALQGSEEKFAKIFQTSPDAINLVTVEQGLCRAVNENFVKLFGYERDELLGRSVLPGDLGIWLDARDRERFVAELEAHGRVVDFETPLRRKDGTVFTAQVSSTRLVVDGEVCNISLTRDITPHKRSEQALIAGAQRLELAAEAGCLGIWDRLLTDETMVWNERMYEIYGVDPATFTPSFTAWWHLLLPEDRPLVQDHMITAFEDGRPAYINFRIRRPSGEVRYVGTNYQVIRDDAGQPVRTLGVSRDRTEQVRAEAEHQRLLDERQHAEKLESLGSLAGGMAHDMNNVLGGILGAAEVLRPLVPADGPGAKALDSILHATGRGRDLVRALTEFSRKGLAQPEPVDLNELLRREVELLSHATLRKVQVELDLEPGLVRVQGDASALGSLFMNLGVNALDAMPGGGVLTFRTRTSPAGGVEVAVIDTGTGMSPEVVARAMEPFFTTKPAGKGTGLGLSRVYGTVTAHGGTVELQSEPGRGTTVLVRLPALHVQRWGGPGPVADLDAKDGPLRVLVVDDDPILLDTLPVLLESAGHRVAVADRGELALARLAEGLEVDAVVLDHNMPGLTGAETLVKMREQRPGLPVVLATGFLDALTENLVSALPGVRVLTKPYRLEDLRRALAAAVAAMRN